MSLGPSWLLWLDLILLLIAVPFLGFCVWWLRAFPVPPLVDIQNSYRREPMLRNPSPIMLGQIPHPMFASAVAMTSVPTYPTSAYMPMRGQTIFVGPDGVEWTIPAAV